MKVKRFGFCLGLLVGSLICANPAAAEFPSNPVRVTGIATIERENNSNNWNLSGSLNSVFVNRLGVVLGSHRNLLESSAEIQFGDTAGNWEETLPTSYPAMSPAEGFGTLVAKAWLENDGVFQALSNAALLNSGLPLEDVETIRFKMYSVELNYPGSQLLALMNPPSPEVAPTLTYGFRIEGATTVFQDVPSSYPVVLSFLNGTECEGCYQRRGPPTEPYTLEELETYALNPDALPPARRDELKADLQALKFGGEIGVEGGTKGFGVKGALKFESNGDVLVRHPELGPLIAARTTGVVVYTGAEAARVAAETVRSDGPGWWSAISNFFSGVVDGRAMERRAVAHPGSM